MRGLFIFDKVNDIIFYKTDDELKENLVLKGFRCGLISDDNYRQIANSTFRNFLVQAFSPMVTSQHVMENQFDNCYKSIVNVDNTFMVFGERLGYIFIYVDHLHSNTLLGGERQLNVFIEYTRLLCGPSIHILGNVPGEQDSQNISPNQILSALFDVWDDLYENEMSFLVEGVERLLINRELSCTCLNLIENVFAKLKGTSNPLQEIFRHAFILVDSKLLYLYSSQNAMDISKGDILLIIALVKVLHLDKKFDNFNATQECLEVKTDDSLKVQLKRRASFLERLFESMTVGESNVTPGIEVMDEEQNIFLEGLYENQRHLGIFLHNRSNNYLNPTPHMLHSLAINDKMKLLVLAEVPQWNIMASGFSTCAETLHNLVKRPLDGNRTLSTKKHLDQHFLRIQNSLKKLKLIGDHDRIVKLVLHKWENLKQIGLNKFLQNSSRLILAPRLEIAITGLCELLRESFEILIYNNLNKFEPYFARAPMVARSMRMIEEGFKRRFADSMDYLFVKAEDNISMASYFQEYPGLIHFIYVDRNMGYMLAPSLKEEYKQKRAEYTASVSKFKVWEMLEICYSQLNKGKSTVLFQDSNFYYSFCLWFEDLNGKPIKPKQFPCVRRYPLPGVISGDFYQNLVFESFPDRKQTYSNKVQVYELFTIHVGIVTPPVIFEQSKKLAASLWEISGAAQTPLDLL